MGRTFPWEGEAVSHLEAGFKGRFRKFSDLHFEPGCTHFKPVFQKRLDAIRSWWEDWAMARFRDIGAVAGRVFAAWWGYMSCAIFTFLSAGTLIWNPSATQQLSIYAGLAAACLIAGCLTTMISLRKEIIDLKSVPPDVELKIEDVVMLRTGDGEAPWANGEFFVQVSVKLLNIPSTNVQYSAQLVFRGEAIELASIQDIDAWEIIERRYFQQPYPNTPSMTLPKQKFLTNPVAVTETLRRSIRNEGWLHFSIEDMREADIAKRTLRLYATASTNACYADEDLTKHHPVRSKLVAMRKPLT